MRAIERMYRILEEMVDSAESRDYERLQRLNRCYEILKPRAVYSDMRELLEGRYDSCKQTILMAETEPGMRDHFLEEARKKLDKISKPRTLT